MTGHQLRPVLGAVSLLVAGCAGPSLGYDETVPEGDGGEDTSGVDGDTLEMVVAFTEDAVAHIEGSAALLAEWQEDPEAVTVSNIDTVRADATALLGRYWNHVLPVREDLAGSPAAGDWDGDAEALAAVLPDHETMLVTIEEAGIGIVDAEGDPRGVTAHRMGDVEFVIEESDALLERTETALAG